VVGDQLNTIALHMIYLVVILKDRSHNRSCKTTKEAWDQLENLFLGNESIQSSKFDEVNINADVFVVIEGDTFEDLYRSITTLVVTMRDLGASHADDKWVKRKFCSALFPYEETRLNFIKQKS
jgi:hypothetical protein